MADKKGFKNIARSITLLIIGIFLGMLSYAYQDNFNIIMPYDSLKAHQGIQKPAPTNRIDFVWAEKGDKVCFISKGVNKFVDVVDTNSMTPTIDIGHLGIEIRVNDKKEIKVGDIISFNSSIYNFSILHRVTNISYDEEGWYARTKGDNNKQPDKEKVRFEQIDGVITAIIY